jgi:hypothetical protein
MSYGVKEYIEWAMEEYEYIHCLNEECKSPNEYPHSPHHIMSRGRYPKHPELHNHKNLIMLCHKCHNPFHHAKTAEEYEKAVKLQERLIIERGLADLFSSPSLTGHGKPATVPK